MPSHTLEYLSVEALRPYGRNARRHPKRQLEQIMASIRCFGFNNPVLIDVGGEIIAGHGRVEAAKRLDLKEVPAIRLQHLSEEEKRAYRLADNQIALKSSWDVELLTAELQALVEIEFDVEVIGFETAELDILFGEAAEASQESGPEDEVPDPPPGGAVTRRGELWVLGHHRLLCADARNEASYEVLLGDEWAQMAFTDPPYNVRIDGHVTGHGRVRHREFAMASGEMSSEGFREFLTCTSGHMAAYSQDGAIHFQCMDWRHAREMLAAGHAVYSELKNLCVWNKDNGGMGSLYRSKHELVFVWKVGTAPHINNVELGRHGRNRTNVWDYAGVNTLRPGRLDELAMHPTVKPVAMVADAIKDCTKPRGIVLDPFAGSGTILIAAEKTGRRARAMEIDPVYADTSVMRWQAHAGKAAVLASTGQTFEEVAEERAAALVEEAV